MTTPLVLVTAKQSVLTAAQESSYDAIVAAMRDAGQSKITWLGAEPRVTRFFSATGNNEVIVSWLGRLPAATPAAAEAIRAGVSAALQGVATSWTNAVVFDYRPDLSGPESFWESGQAAATLTNREQNRTSTVLENPYGPDSVILDIQRDWDRRDEAEQPGWVKILPWVAVFALGAWGISKVTESAKTLRGAPRKNPRGRRSRDTTWMGLDV